MCSLRDGRKSRDLRWKSPVLVNLVICSASETCSLRAASRSGELWVMGERGSKLGQQHDPEVVGSRRSSQRGSKLGQQHNPEVVGSSPTVVTGVLDGRVKSDGGDRPPSDHRFDHQRAV